MIDRSSTRQTSKSQEDNVVVLYFRLLFYSNRPLWTGMSFTKLLSLNSLSLSSTNQLSVSLSLSQHKCVCSCVCHMQRDTLELSMQGTDPRWRRYQFSSAHFAGQVENWIGLARQLGHFKKGNIVDDFFDCSPRQIKVGKLFNCSGKKQRENDIILAKFDQGAGPGTTQWGLFNFQNTGTLMRTWKWRCLMKELDVPFWSSVYLSTVIARCLFPFKSVPFRTDRPETNSPHLILIKQSGHSEIGMLLLVLLLLPSRSICHDELCSRPSPVRWVVRATRSSVCTRHFKSRKTLIYCRASKQETRRVGSVRACWIGDWLWWNRRSVNDCFSFQPTIRKYFPTGMNIQSVGSIHCSLCPSSGSFSFYSRPANALYQFMSS